MTTRRIRRHLGQARVLIAVLVLVLIGTSTAAMAHAHRGHVHQSHDCGACSLASASVLSTDAIPHLDGNGPVRSSALPPQPSWPWAEAPRRLPARAPPTTTLWSPFGACACRSV